MLTDHGPLIVGGGVLAAKYQSIIDEIHAMALRGELKPGDRLPSIRETSQRFNCNKSTVIRAYMEMEKEHAVYAVPQSGYYLVGRKNGAESENVETIDLTSAGPAMEFMPYREFQHCMNQAIDTYKHELFNYGPPEGLLSLRKVLSKLFQDNQVFTREEQMMVTTGSQQALEILASMEFPNGKQNILVEQPTFSGMFGACRQLGVKVMGIERSWNGINLEDLERVFRNGNIKFFYTIPRFHNPTGTSLTNEEKRQIIKLAQIYDVYIVEDDYLADLETDTKSDPIYALEGSSRVAYVRSFSKTLMPGLRLGAAVLPPILVHPYRERKRSSDLGSSMISQAALEIFISSGVYRNHVQKIRVSYQERMMNLKQLVRELLPQLRHSDPSTGLFMALEAPCGAARLCHALQERNVLMASVDRMRLPEFQRDDQIRLSLTRVNTDQMRVGIEAIAGEVRRLSPGSLESQKEYRVEIL